MNKKNKLSYIKFSVMRQRLNEYGVDMSMKKYCGILFLIALICLIVSIVFKLKPAYIVLVVFSFLLCTPLLIIYKVKFNHQHKRFIEVTLYLQQMAYSFRRRSKILNALKEVEKLSSGHMNKCINKAILYIENGSYEKNLFAEALEIIEDEYKCSRIKTLHSFMIEVEQMGGEYKRTLNTLIQDIENWITRTMSYQRNRKHMQLQTTISIGMALSLCAMVCYMLPKEISNVTNLFNSPFYQIMTFATLVSFVIFYIVVLAKTSTSWLDLEDLKNTYTFKDIKRDYTLITNKDAGKISVMQFSLAAIFTVFCIALFLITKNFIIIPFGLGFVVILLVNSRVQLKQAKKRLQNDITINFPNWIRSLVLLLQTNNLYISLEKSLNECSGALRIEVAKLIENLVNDPVSQEPFLLFMEYFDAPDMKSIIRSLYGMSEYGQAETIDQINIIINRNNELSAISEKLADSLKISGMNLFVLLPMVIGSANMFCSLFIFGSSFFSYFNLDGIMM